MYFYRCQLFVLIFFDLFVWISLLLKHLKQGIVYSLLTSELGPSVKQDISILL